MKNKITNRNLWEVQGTGFTNESDMNTGRNMHKFVIKSSEPMNQRYGNSIANILGNESDAKATANLMAAAPEMRGELEAVAILLIHIIETGNPMVEACQSRLNFIRETITKAERK